MPQEHSSRLDALVAHLPFAIDDFDAAAEAFARWREHDAEADRETALLWAYCYVLWYFYSRFARERTAEPSDVDWVIERAFKRVARSFEEVRKPGHFPQFVSVVCRNALLSYRDRRRTAVEADETTAPTPARGAEGYDRLLTRHLLDDALRSLPDGVAEVARLRLLHGASYQEIAATTGHPIATARAYYSRAIGELRADPHLRALHDGSVPPSALAESSKKTRRGLQKIGRLGARISDSRKEPRLKS